MANPARPWTRFYHPLTAPDLAASRWPHLAAAVREAAATYSDRTAFTLSLPNGSQGGLTFSEVDRLSDQFAVYLREVAGFKAGDRIALQMPNCLAYPIAVFGTLKAGLVMVNTNPLYTAPEMVHQFADSGAVGLVAIDLFATKVQEALPKTSIRTVVVVSIADLLPALQAAARARRPEVRQEDGAADPFRAHDLHERARTGRRAHHGRRRSARLRVVAERRQHRGTAVHRRHHGRGQGRGAHARQSGRQHRCRASRRGSRCFASARR